MLSLKVPLRDAQKVKGILLKKGLMDCSCRPKKEAGFLYFPLVKCASIGYPVVDMDLERSAEKTTVRTRLARTLSPEEMRRLKTSADIVGSIAIIELEENLLSKKKEIAEEFLRQNKAIRTVLAKRGGHEGELRIQQYEFLAGTDTRETVHKENGVLLKLDVEKVYYSPRTATERLRIARLVKSGERVLVMFSGCAPFPCVIAKNAKPKEVVGIELNPDGHAYGVENVRLNKLKSVQLVEGDVRDVVPKLGTAFDRIIMPLPKTGGDFLGVAFGAAHAETIIHFYSFQKEGEFGKAEDALRDACAKAGRTCKVLRTVRAGQVGQRTFRICVDAEIGQ